MQAEFFFSVHPAQAYDQLAVDLAQTFNKSLA